MPAPWGSAPNAWSIDGRVIHLTRPSVAELIPLVLLPSPVHLVLVTARDPEDLGYLYGRILDRNDRLGDETLDDIADGIVKAIVGLERWTVERLWREAHGSWAVIDGGFLGKGVDIMDLDPARATSVVYTLLQKWHADDKAKLERWRKDLLTPPVRAASSPKQLESAADAFAQVQALAAMAGQRG